MLSDLWNSILAFFQWLFNWLYEHIIAHIIYYINQFWNWIIDRFWDLFTAFVSWVCDMIAGALGSDLDYDSTWESVFNNIVGFDQIFPIHESFLLLSFLLSYHLIRLALRYGTYVISMIRKLLPF